MRRALRALALLTSLACAAMPASAEAGGASATLARVRATGVIHCGATERPGLLATSAQGVGGLLVDLCHAIGVAAAGPAVKVDAHVYDAETDFDAVRAGRDDVIFLSGGEMVEEKLAGLIVPGPPVAFVSVALMVARSAPFKQPADLAGQSICFQQGDDAHRALEAYFARQRRSFVRMGYQEEDELHDAFDAGQCQALVGEATTLASVRLGGQNLLHGARILDSPLATFPIFAATNASDGAWSALVVWTLETLIAAGRPRQAWSAGGAEALPIAARALGLAPEALSDALAATGGYRAMVRRNLGEGSPLALPSGANALADQGGLLTPPYAE
jgi:general L-amino acid transport system substrate-binding protein